MQNEGLAGLLCKPLSNWDVTGPVARVSGRSLRRIGGRSLGLVLWVVILVLKLIPKLLLEVVFGVVNLGLQALRVLLLLQGFWRLRWALVSKLILLANLLQPWRGPGTHLLGKVLQRLMSIVHVERRAHCLLETIKPVWHRRLRREHAVEMNQRRRVVAVESMQNATLALPSMGRLSSQLEW